MRPRSWDSIGIKPVDDGSATVASICETVCERAQELLLADGASVSVLLHRSDELVSVACTGGLSAFSSLRFSVDDHASGPAVRGGRTFTENQLGSSGGTGPEHGLPPTAERLLAVPLVSWNDTVGTLTLIRNEDSADFTDADARLLEGYSVPVALSLDRAERLAEARASVEVQAQLRRNAESFVSDLHRLHRAETALASGLDLDTVLDRVVETAVDLTDARGAALGLLDESKRTFVRFVRSNGTASRSGRVETLDDDPLAEIVATGRPVCVRNHSKCGCDECEHMPAVTSRDLVGVPVRADDELLGILYLHGKADRGPFSERDEAIVQMLASQAAGVMHKARLLDERQEAIRELETQRAVRTRLSAYVSHDIRNALQGVSMWADRITDRIADGAKDPSSEEIAGFTGKVHSGTDHALRLVRDVLDLTALEEGRLDVWPRSFPLAHLLRSTVEAHSPDAERAGIGILVDCADDLTLVGDPDRIRQIVTNLLSNAVKFASESPTVRLVARSRDRAPDGAPGAWVSIDVEDDGPGVAEEQIAKIFGAYERGMAGRREAGTGLGLTISRLLARRMGGQLFVRSTRGKGATFTLWLPAEREPEDREGWIG